MKLVETELAGVVIIEPAVFRDDRGFFFESYSEPKLAHLGIETRFVQDNHSWSLPSVLRGMHFQLGEDGGPGQAKLVRVTSGRVIDVAVDVRRGSPTFLASVTVELSSETHRMLYIPAGFAHGFWALEESVVLYKCSATYAPERERGVRWDDPSLGIHWPHKTPLLSPRDAGLPRIEEMAETDLPEHVTHG
ncbi:MAG: dTDP-4-dehydrorhamnose 3,5-epimerase [Myxococcales bacterium]|nr:dTDP-4-dehydrorhamnose 3,5-epimerase [Myxococcales bacterium]